MFPLNKIAHARVGASITLSYSAVKLLSSFKFVQWAPKDASGCVLAVQGRSGSSKVDDFGTNRKRVYDFLLVRHCDYGPILHRFRDMVTWKWENCQFFLPLSHSAPSLPMFPLEFCCEANQEETIVMGLSSSEDPMILA